MSESKARRGGWAGSGVELRTVGRSAASLLPPGARSSPSLPPLLPASHNPQAAQSPPELVQQAQGLGAKAAEQGACGGAPRTTCSTLASRPAAHRLARPPSSSSEHRPQQGGPGRPGAQGQRRPGPHGRAVRHRGGAVRERRQGAAVSSSPHSIQWGAARAASQPASQPVASGGRR